MNAVYNRVELLLKILAASLLLWIKCLQIHELEDMVQQLGQQHHPIQPT